MKNGPRTLVVLCIAAIAASTGISVRGQQGPSSRSIAASGGTLGAWASRVDAMLGDGTLDVVAVQSDTMIAGRIHERLAQRHEGLPVFGGQVVRQLDGRSIVSVFGRLYDMVSVPTTTPSIDAASAAAAAQDAAGDRAVAGPAELGILPKGGGYVLAYRVTVRSPWDVRTYFVNATTGAIEHHISQIRSQERPVVGKGVGVLSDDKKVSANQASGGFQTIDVLRPAVAFTLDFRGSAVRLNNFLETGRLFISDVAFSTNNTWTDGAVVDAHAYQGWVYDYYFKRFGRRGLDDNDFEVISIVHPLARAEADRFPPDIVNLFINNALYVHPGLLFFGDGDGRLFDFLAGGLDVVGHELTHGITEFTSQLEYQDESGALNEAFSDIMATGLEFFHLTGGSGPQRGPNFLMGEDVTKVSPGFVRSLQNPIDGGDPDHYSLREFIGTSIDNGGVHINATIVGHTFYLAVAGGTNRVSGIRVDGIGVANIARMEQIFYRAFVFMLTPLAQFADARAATLQAAADLYGAGSNEQAQLRQAWNAVGVQ